MILVEICRKLKLNEPSYATSENSSTQMTSNGLMMPMPGFLNQDDSKKFECKCVLPFAAGRRLKRRWLELVLVLGVIDDLP